MKLVFTYFGIKRTILIFFHFRKCNETNLSLAICKLIFRLIILYTGQTQTTIELYMIHTRYENLAQSNNLFPMRDWHVKHMQYTIVKYLTGLSENATRYQKRINKKYGNLTQVTKRIEYDLKHGVEMQEILAFLELIKTDQSFSELRQILGFGTDFMTCRQVF